jgi:hypothetical protein
MTGFRIRTLTAATTALSSAVLAVGMITAPALAANTWTVKPGGAGAGSSSNVALTDTKTGNPLPTTCDAELKITLKSGSGLPGTSVGSVTSAAFSSCLWVLGLMPTMTASHLPWHLNAQSYDSSTGTTTGTITGIHLSITGPSCSTVVDGTSANADDGQINFHYANGTHKLTFPTGSGNLHYYQVSGCLGLVASGDPASLTATSTVTPAQTITSP